MDGKPFALKSTDQSFRERQKNVFDQISTLETNLQSTTITKTTHNLNQMEVVADEDPTTSPRHNKNMRHFRGKESIFKRPREPPARHYMRTMPDFKKNPHRWTKYTLDDVKDEDMSDRGNTRAAFSFLNELKRRKTAEEEEMDQDDSDRPQKIVFKKSTVAANVNKQHTVENEEEAKSSFRSSKVVMPEYVVGQKKKKEKKNKETKSGDGRALKLDHLFDEEED